jgi:CRP/FNR family cyclic AMP-dependent transcriptional regulator
MQPGDPRPTRGAGVFRALPWRLAQYRERVLCNRLRKTDEHIAEVALLQLPARLARALLRALAAGDAPPAGRKTEPIQLSQGDLGKLVGAARESVNRCLRTWQQDGIIAIKGGLIVINDRTALEELAEPG